MNGDLKKKFGELFSIVISSFDFNMLQHKIQLNCYNPSLNKNITLVFNDVFGFLWINNVESRKTPLYDWEYYELTSIDLLDEIKCEYILNGSNWMNNYKFQPNIVIDIWFPVLMIECKSITVDGQEYLLDI